MQIRGSEFKKRFSLLIFVGPCKLLRRIPQRFQNAQIWSLAWRPTMTGKGPCCECFAWDDECRKNVGQFRFTEDNVNRNSRDATHKHGAVIGTISRQYRPLISANNNLLPCRHIENITGKITSEIAGHPFWSAVPFKKKHAKDRARSHRNGDRHRGTPAMPNRRPEANHCLGILSPR